MAGAVTGSLARPGGGPSLRGTPAGTSGFGEGSLARATAAATANKGGGSRAHSGGGGGGTERSRSRGGGGGVGVGMGMGMGMGGGGGSGGGGGGGGGGGEGGSTRSFFGDAVETLSSSLTRPDGVFAGLPLVGGGGEGGGNPRKSGSGSVSRSLNASSSRPRTTFVANTQANARSVQLASSGSRVGGVLLDLAAMGAGSTFDRTKVGLGARATSVRLASFLVMDPDAASRKRF